MRPLDRFLTINGVGTANEAEVRAAFARARDGRLRAVLDRAGTVIVIDNDLPEMARYVFPLEPWSRRGSATVEGVR